MADRRQILIGAAGAIAASTSLAGRAMAAPPAAKAGNDIYDYLFVDLATGDRGSSQKAFVAALGASAAAVRAAGGEAIGYFTPQIGWTSHQIAVLLRWKGDTSGREQAVRAIATHPAVAKAEHSKLSATTRPAPDDLPLTTGIYTHRWFDVKTADVPEFIDLSNRAWPAFEREFASRVFGLFRVTQTDEDARRGVTRMLLNTQYDSHAVWEASRRPSAEPADLFNRRGDLTITTRVASIRFNPLG